MPIFITRLCSMYKMLILSILLNINGKTKKFHVIFSALDFLKSLMRVIVPVHKSYGFITKPLNSACVHGIVGLCVLCHKAKQSTIIACTHSWMVFSDPTMLGVACDFNLPIHTAATTINSIVHVCSVCHAVACNGCFTG